MRKSDSYSLQPIQKRRQKGEIHVIDDRGSDLSSSDGAASESQFSNDGCSAANVSGIIMDKEMQTKLLRQQETENLKRNQIYKNMIMQNLLTQQRPSTTHVPNNSLTLQNQAMSWGSQAPQLRANNEFNLGID